MKSTPPAFTAGSQTWVRKLLCERSACQPSSRTTARRGRSTWFDVRASCGIELAVYRLAADGDLLDREGGWRTRLGMTDAGAVLVRPDGLWPGAALCRSSLSGSSGRYSRPSSAARRQINQFDSPSGCPSRRRGRLSRVNPITRESHHPELTRGQCAPQKACAKDPRGHTPRRAGGNQLVVDRAQRSRRRGQR